MEKRVEGERRAFRQVIGIGAPGHGVGLKPRADRKTACLVRIEAHADGGFLPKPLKERLGLFIAPMGAHQFHEV